MILDALTVAALAAELAGRHEGLRIRRARADEHGLDILFESRDPEHEPYGRMHLHYGPAGDLAFRPAGDFVSGAGRERYLEGARVDAIRAQVGDRALEIDLSREDGNSRPTHGVLHIQLFPPCYRAILVSCSHGRILGLWASAADRRAPAHGAVYTPPAAPPGSVLPGHVTLEVFIDTLQAEGGELGRALRQTLIGADRHLTQRLCVDSGVDAETPTAALAPADMERLWSTAGRLWSPSSGEVFLWRRGQARLSVVAPANEVDLDRFASVTAALVVDDTAPGHDKVGSPQQAHRLRQVLRVLQRRAAGLQADLDETAAASRLKRLGDSVLAAADRLAPGTSGSVADVHSHDGSDTLAVELQAGESAVQHGTRLLRRVAKLRRRAQSLPPRLRHTHELIVETEALLGRLQRGEPIDDQAIERWEHRVEVRRPQQEKAEVDKSEDQRHGARPRRYLTSTGWSVWAGRNNHENDVVTHRLAGQNDIWFHAHGYAGSHVILRRQGRKEEPDPRTLEEAAAVAAYWSKGRTANKVPVVYTLAKFVSKPRGAPAGLAVMKREKTIMVRPDLITEEGTA